MFKIDKDKVFRVKWNDLRLHKDKLDKVSGLYFYHVNKKLLYLGKAVNLWSRFGHGYLKEDSKVHKNTSLMKLISVKSDMVEVIFVPMDEADLKEQETLFIQTYLPQFNIAENPRCQVRSIQRVIARIVNESSHEWEYAKMRKHLLIKWKNEVSIELINQALANESSNLSRYCCVNSKQKVLMPRMNNA